MSEIPEEQIVKCTEEYCTNQAALCGASEKVEEFNQQGQSLNNDATKWSQMVTNLNNSPNSMHQKFDDCKEKVAETLRDLKYLEVKSKEEKDVLECQLRSVEDEYSALHDKYSTLQHDFDKYKKNCEILELTIKETKQETIQLKEEKHYLNLQIQQKTKQVNEKNIDYDKLMKDTEQTKQQVIEDYECQLLEKTSQIEDMKKESDELIASLSREYEEWKQQGRQKQDKLEGHLKDAESKIDEMSKSLKHAESEIDEMSKSLKHITKERNALTTNYEIVKQQNKQMKEEIENIQSELQVRKYMNQKNKSLEAHLVAYKEKYDKLEQQSQKQEDTIDDLKCNLKAAKCEIDEKLNLLKNAEKGNNKAEKKLKELNMNVLIMPSAAVSTTTDDCIACAKKTEELDKTKAQLSKVTKNFEQTSHECKHITAINQELQSELEIRKRIDQRNNNKLAARLITYKENCVKLEQHIQQQEHIIDDLKCQITDVKCKIEETSKLLKHARNEKYEAEVKMKVYEEQLNNTQSSNLTCTVGVGTSEMQDHNTNYVKNMKKKSILNKYRMQLPPPRYHYRLRVYQKWLAARKSGC